MPTIKMTLGKKSISAAIRQLEKYQNSFPVKLERLRQRVADELAAYMRIGFNGAEGEFILYEGYQVPSVSVTTENDGNVTMVIANGTEAVFIEFGAGVYFNPSGTPNQRPPGIVNIGEYGKGYGKRKVWGYYDESGELKLTHGTPASMPMYYAVQQILPRIPQIAKEVFGGGG